MRKDPTRAEWMLWWSLSCSALGVKFHRQVPIGPYIADFACFSHRLIVEIDGPTHDTREQYDNRRDHWFQARGWRIIRITDEDVWRTRSEVIAMILMELGLEP